jgi:hypothetical protein
MAATQKNFGRLTSGTSLTGSDKKSGREAGLGSKAEPKA